MQISFAFFSFYALATAFPSVPQSDMVMEIDERDPQCVSYYLTSCISSSVLTRLIFQCVQYFCNDIVKCPTAGTGPEAVSRTTLPAYLELRANSLFLSAAMLA